MLAQCLRDGAGVPSCAGRVRGGPAHAGGADRGGGARSSSAKTPTALLRPLSDAALRLVFRYAVTDRGTAWMYDHRIDRAAG